MKMTLSDLVLAIISDNPGANLRTITEAAASWGTVLSYLTTNPSAAWTLALAHGDRVNSIEKRAAQYVADLQQRGLVAGSDATFRVTAAGSAHLRKLGL